MNNTSPTTVDRDQLVDLIVEEIVHALRLPRLGVYIHLFRPLVRRLTLRFAEFAVEFDHHIATLGFREAAGRFADHFVEGRTADGVEAVPTAGPLIIAANHPGATDAFSIIASLPRDDAALVISDVPITRALPHTAGHFIHVSGEMDSHVRAVRDMTRHLQVGGTVVIFPSKNLTPDPKNVTRQRGVAGGSAGNALRTLADATFGAWSQSILLPLKRVRECTILPAIVSGVLDPKYARHLLTRYIPASRSWERQLLAEVLQVMYQIRTANPLGLIPHVQFGEPIAAVELAGLSREAAMAAIVDRARPLLALASP
jgi:hypothetical protein